MRNLVESDDGLDEGEYAEGLGLLEFAVREDWEHLGFILVEVEGGVVVKVRLADAAEGCETCEGVLWADAEVGDETLLGLVVENTWGAEGRRLLIGEEVVGGLLVGAVVVVVLVVVVVEEGEEDGALKGNENGATYGIISLRSRE